MYLLVLLYWCELQCLVWFLSVSHEVVVVTTGVMRMICTRPWLDTHLLQVLPGAEGVHKLLSGGWQCVHCELSGQYCPGLRPLCQQITNTQWSVLWTEVLYPMLSDDKTHTMVSSGWFSTLGLCDTEFIVSNVVWGATALFSITNSFKGHKVFALIWPPWLTGSKKTTSYWHKVQTTRQQTVLYLLDH